MNQLKNLKILYIDDEDYIRANAVEYLSFYCDNVYEAYDGISGLESYEKYKPDIIITDIKMPKLNGIEMVKKIRQKDKKTKVILATAFLETSYLLQAVELGLIKYLTKPITADKLLPVLRTCTIDITEDKSIYNLGEGFLFDILIRIYFIIKNKYLWQKKSFYF